MYSTKDSALSKRINKHILVLRLQMVATASVIVLSLIFCCYLTAEYFYRMTPFQDIKWALPMVGGISVINLFFLDYYSMVRDDLKQIKSLMLETVVKAELKNG